MGQRRLSAHLETVALVVRNGGAFDCYKSIEALNRNPKTDVLLHNSLVYCDKREIFNLLQGAARLIVLRALQQDASQAPLHLI